MQLLIYKRLSYVVIAPYYLYKTYGCHCFQNKAPGESETHVLLHDGNTAPILLMVKLVWKDITSETGTHCVYDPDSVISILLAVY